MSPEPPDLWWPKIEPPLTEEEKELLRAIEEETEGIGFFGATNGDDYIHILAIAVRMTREKDAVPNV